MSDRARQSWSARAALLVLCGVIAGCETAPPPAAAPRAIEPAPLLSAQPAPHAPLPPDLNSPEGAARALSDLPAPDARTRQEIRLHAALYRAAWESNVGDFTDHFLLDQPSVAAPLALSIDDQEFRLRVLAELAQWGAPVAWSEAPVGNEGDEFFPGTTALATHLRIWIHQRIEAEATVAAEVGDYTLHVGSSRQVVTALWDGEAWRLERDAVRIVW